jgi:REP element-mobilizing transposase RayT
MARSNGRDLLFRQESDCEDFLKRIPVCQEKNPLEILAWALLPNHFHLLVRSKSGKLSSFMRRLVTGYAVSFNMRHGRRGHVFQNRYKSLICEEEPYLLELVRYIHLNPVRAGTVKSLEELREYPYTGHSTLMNHNPRPWQAVGEVLSLYGAETGMARTGYEEFIRAGWGKDRQPDLTGDRMRKHDGVRRAAGERWPEVRELSDSRVLGSGEFVDQVLARAGIPKPPSKTLGDFENAAASIARSFGISADMFRIKRRSAILSKAKAVLIYVGIEHYGLTTKAMAEMTRMSMPAASQAWVRGRILWEEKKAGPGS